MPDKAVFCVETSRDMLLNPKDTASHPSGIWSLPPTMAGTEEEKRSIWLLAKLTKWY